MTVTINSTTSRLTKQAPLTKKWLFVALSAAVLTLTACDKKDDSTIEGSALEFDSETSEAEAAAEVAASNPMNSSSTESAILPSADMPEGTGEISGTGAGGGEVATAGLDMKSGMYTDTPNSSVEKPNVGSANAENTNDGVAVGVDDSSASEDIEIVEESSTY